MDDFPRMLYRAPGAMDIHGAKFDTLVVSGESAQADALAGGWYLSTPEAAAALQATKDAAAAAELAATLAAVSNPDAPPTRAELEQKATELGIKIDGRWSDRKLADLIRATLEA